MAVNNISLLLDQIITMIDEDNIVDLSTKINSLHEADAAEVIQLLTPTYRKEMIILMGKKLNPVILTYMDEPVRDAVIDLLADHELSAALSRIDEQDALELLSEFTQEERRNLFRTLQPELRIALEEGLSYPENSAGRLMRHEFVALPKGMLILQAIAFLHSAKEQSIETNIIFLVDEKRKPVACLNFASLVLADSNQTLFDISEPIVTQVLVSDTTEDIAHVFTKYFVSTIPVTDNKNRLVGIIQLNSVIDIIYEQAQEGFLQSAGITESDFYETIWASLSSRLKWIAVAGMYSLVSAWVVSAFQDIIERYTIIPALNQILLAVTGTAGIQTVTVTIRALIGRDLIAVNAVRAVRKEAIIGVLNGLISAIFLTCILLFYISNHEQVFTISFIFGVSIFLGITVSTIAGSIIPILLTRLDIDPSVSASPLLASLADASGLLIILSLAQFLL